MPVCGNYLFFELPKKIVLNPKDGQSEPHQPFQKRAAVAARLRASAHTGMGQKCA